MTSPDMQHTVARSIVDHLARAGVRHVYGVPGEHSLAIVDAIAERSGLEFISTRHESGAAFMAEADGKLTGVPAVCLVTASVGATNMMAGLNVASHDSTPFLAIVGQVATGFRGRDAWQEIDIVGALGPLSKSAVEVTNPELVSEAILRAVRLCTSGRPGPVVLSLPVDLQDQVVGAPPLRDLGMDFPPAASAAAVEAVDAELSGAQRPLIVAGGGVVRDGAVDDLVALSELLPAPVATSFRRPDAFPSPHPHYLGSLGLSSTQALRRAAVDADLIVAVGTRLSELTTNRYQYPTPRQRVVHIDVDAQTLASQPFSHALRVQSSAGDALRKIAAALRPGNARHGKWWSRLAEGSDGGASVTVDGADELVRAARDIDRALPAGAVVTSDAGDFFVPVTRHLGFPGQRRYLGPTSGSMGYGLPAAVAARLAAPEATVVSFVGDGGLMMTFQELETAVRLGLGILVVVFNDSAYGSIRRHQINRYQSRLTGSMLSSVDFVQLADSVGARGIRADSATDYAALAADARTARRPIVVEIVQGRPES